MALEGKINPRLDLLREKSPTDQAIFRAESAFPIKKTELARALLYELLLNRY